MIKFKSWVYLKTDIENFDDLIMHSKYKILPFMVHPVTVVQLPLSSHWTCAGEAVPSYPVAHAAFEVPRYVVAVVPVKS